PARCLSAQHLCEQARFGIARLVDGSRDPTHIYARQLDLISYHGMALRADGRSGCTDFGDRRARRDRTEVFFHQSLGLTRIEVAGDSQAGVVGRVVLAEELAHVIQAGSLDVMM